jgi:hypothetical protein
VTGPDPGVITLDQNPAPFDTTLIQPQPSNISINDASATEGGALNFTVSLDAPQDAPVTVQFATADGSAFAPGDYTAATGTVTFAPGDTSEPVTVQTIDDTLVEGDETFNVNLSNPTGNAAILDGMGVGTIISDGPDLPPTANAGADQTVAEGDLVTLDGTGSSDPNPEALTFNWTAPAGITLSDPTSPTPTFTAPFVDADTPLTFTLEVCDEANPAMLCSDPDDTVTVTHLNVNQQPTANAGPDQTATEGSLVTLAGSGTDPEGEALTFNWTAPAGITLSDPTSPTPVFVVPDVAMTTPFTFTLEVCDPEPLCDTDTVVVTVPVGFTEATGIVIVNGPVSSTKTSKSFVFKVSSVGMAPITFNESNITSSVDVNGLLTGSVAVNPFTKTLTPGASTRVKLVWSYPAGSLATGDSVVFHACLAVAGDIDPTNDCDDATATAR